ncbi:MAG: TIGR04282 family arsenosugar biosynthesis glycosyltransferase [Candidatus Krumholzibacteria bacterium]|nr:TIGR04282 family arsenosugar biosynthesis glycosyltransferase [Candidatus Krumholzibacteria bacterium]
MSETLIIFTRFPEPGRTKTRLMPELGANGAAALHRALVERTLHTVRQASETRDVVLEIHHTGEVAPMQAWLGAEWKYRPQAAGDLGARMLASLAAADGPAVLIGTDCPDLTPEILVGAFAALPQNDVVLGPAADGGYYLVGMNSARPEIFVDIPWGGAQVLSSTRDRLAQAGLRWHELAILSDIDRPEDLARVPRELLPDRSFTRSFVRKKD